MPQVLRARGAKDGASGIRAFLACPAYAGHSSAFVTALFASQAALAGAGIDSDLEIFAGNCHVDDSRNRLVRDFLETDATDLVFLDADLYWHAHDLVSLLTVDRDIVAGIYPLKEPHESYPVRCLPGDRWTDVDGLLAVDAVPTGFLRIRRRVLEHLAADAPGFPSKDDDEGRALVPLIFERTLEDGMRWGGDYMFCRKARAAGYQIHIDPMMRFIHVGDHSWRGSVGEFWRREAGVVYPQRLAEIRSGTETHRTFEELVSAWGNYPWSVGPNLAAACVLIARETAGDILECGSGLSTLILAAAAPQSGVWALEHDASWAAHMRQVLAEQGLDNARIVDAPLAPIPGEGTERRWYEPPAGALPAKISMVLCDGPPRALLGAGGRGAMLDALDGRLAPGCALVVDDAESRSLLDAWEIRLGTRFHVMKGQKHYAIARVPGVTEASAA